MKASTLLDVRGLTVDYPSATGPIRVVDGVDLRVGVGERVALVGESGSGKSVTSKALMRLHPQARLGGHAYFEGADILTLPEAQMQKLRGSGIGMVFQDPFGALDPSMPIGRQIAEVLRIRGVSRREAESRAVATLDELRVPRASECMSSYAHEFSGGMLQRVVMAMALIAEPRLLIADEATTALDPRIQEQVLDLIYSVSVDRGIAVMLISHDLGVVAGLADRVMVMYAGRIVETAEVNDLFTAPKHPYSRGLLHAVPRIDSARALVSIPGSPPDPVSRPVGCAFQPRCVDRIDACLTERPRLLPLADNTTTVACHVPAEGLAEVMAR